MFLILLHQYMTLMTMSSRLDANHHFSNGSASDIVLISDSSLWESAADEAETKVPLSQPGLPPHMPLTISLFFPVGSRTGSQLKCIVTPPGNRQISPGPSVDWINTLSYGYKIIFILMVYHAPYYSIILTAGICWEYSLSPSGEFPFWQR